VDVRLLERPTTAGEVLSDYSWKRKCRMQGSYLGPLTQARPESGVGVSYPEYTAMFWGPRRCSEIQKYTSMHYFKKKNSNIFSPKGPSKNV